MVTGAVLDSSVVVDAVLGRVSVPEFDTFHAHAGLDIEVISALRRKALHGDTAPHIARDGLDVFLQLEITRHPLRRFVPRIWTLRDDISAYDAGYVALAEALGMPLLTLDKKLAKTAQRYCDVIVP